MTSSKEHLPQSPREQAAHTVEAGLRASFGIHEKLGPEGVHETEINQFGDTQLAVDVGSERAILQVMEETGLPIDVRGEELGQLQLAEGQSGPRLLAVIDGLDGSSLYKKERGIGNYGTMFALYENNNPRYDEYLAAGIMLHSAARLLLAVKGAGVRSIDVQSGDGASVTASTDNLTPDALIYTDDDASVTPDNVLYPYFQTNLKTWAEPLRAAGFTTQRTGSSAGYYADLALGKALVVGEATRKGNLELATAYAIVREAGGKILDAKTWADIGDKHFLTYGQQTHEPLVAVANQGVANQLREITT